MKVLVTRLISYLSYIIVTVLFAVIISILFTDGSNYLDMLLPCMLSMLFLISGAIARISFVKDAKKRRRTIKITLRLIFFCYIIAVLIFLFFRHESNISILSRNSEVFFENYMEKSTNFIPFSTIISLQDYLSDFITAAMFVPLGLLLPTFLRFCRNFFLFFIVSFSLLLAVETLQIIFLIETCNIDNLILSLIGAIIGFLISKGVKRVLYDSQKGQAEEFLDDEEESEDNMEIFYNENEQLVKGIKAALKRNEGYCPCVPNRTEDTKCICKEFREQKQSGYCHCKLYYKEVG